MASKYWIKLYHEMLDDPKMARLSDTLYRRVIELFLLAGKTGDSGRLPTTEDIAWHLRVDEAQLETELDELSKVGIVTHDAEGWIVTHFAERQAARTDAQRMRRYRQRQRSLQYRDKTEPPTVTGSVTKRNTESDNNQITESESESEENQITESDRQNVTDDDDPPPTPESFEEKPDQRIDPAFGGIIRQWFKLVDGQVNPTDGERIGDLLDDYGAEAVTAAIERATEQKTKNGTRIRSPNYLAAILESAVEETTPDFLAAWVAEGD